MADDAAPRARYGEAFWRAHHEAWKRSDLNQRQYCEAQGISLKAFGNWRAKFKAEPQPPARKLLYRRGGASHSLGHTPSHTLGHATYPSFALVSILQENRAVLEVCAQELLKQETLDEPALRETDEGSQARADDAAEC